MNLHAVVPVKDLARAKSRLAGALSPAERRALVREMLGCVLGALAACRLQAVACGAEGLPLSGPDEIWVISPDPEVLALAAAAGARPLPERSDGLNPALEQARAALRAAGADAMLVVPADLPLIEPDDLCGLGAALAGGADVVIAPDEAGQGTNALGLWLSADLPFRFGEGSFQRHLAAARWRELTVEVRRSPTLALDVDTPSGLREYRERQMP